MKPNEYRMEKVAAFIVDRRRRLNMTAADLARITGLSRSFICQVEHGCRSISLQTAFRLCNALKVNIKRLADIAMGGGAS